MRMWGGFKRISQRELKRLLKKADIDIEEVQGVSRVVIERDDGSRIIISNPMVTKLKMAGQTVYQVAGGEERVEEAEVEVSEEDIAIVMEQTGVDRETARNALVMTKGDIAEAIMLLKGEGSSGG